jgi:Ran GTPase-activating protein (RanGAP) involved in mRNA processing and transport
MAPIDSSARDPVFVTSEGKSKKLIAGQVLVADSARKRLRRYSKSTVGRAWTFRKVRQIGILKMHYNGVDRDTLTQFTGIKSEALEKLIKPNVKDPTNLFLATSFFDS